jgi:hypothetical protein
MAMKNSPSSRTAFGTLPGLVQSAVSTLYGDAVKLGTAVQAVEYLTGGKETGSMSAVAMSPTAFDTGPRFSIA